MYPIDHDYEIEKQAHPENFEPMNIESESVKSELFCPNCKKRLWEYSQADGADDYHMVAYCKNCDYITE